MHLPYSLWKNLLLIISPSLAPWLSSTWLGISGLSAIIRAEISTPLLCKFLIDFVSRKHFHYVACCWASMLLCYIWLKSRWVMQWKMSIWVFGFLQGYSPHIIFLLDFKCTVLPCHLPDIACPLLLLLCCVSTLLLTPVSTASLLPNLTFLYFVIVLDVSAPQIFAHFITQVYMTDRWPHTIQQLTSPSKIMYQIYWGVFVHRFRMI